MDNLLRIFLLIAMMVGVGVVGYAAIAALNMWTRRREGMSGPGQDQLDALHARLAGAEALEARVEELEQRVDFAERLIAQQHEPERLPAGPAPGHR